MTDEWRGVLLRFNVCLFIMEFAHDLVLSNDGYQLFVTLGQFSIIRLERDIQLLMPAYDVCLPRRDCSNSGVGGEQDPCEFFCASMSVCLLWSLRSISCFVFSSAV